MAGLLTIWAALSKKNADFPDLFPRARAVADGQSTHACHAQIARRANVPQFGALAPSGKSKASSCPSRLDGEGRYGRSSRNVGRDAVDAAAPARKVVAGRDNS
jgi:hypothetical protein